ncbi:Microfibrillar-associated protein 1, partial [Globisporangium splendens]
MALFTKKDLGLLLPDDTPGDPVSLRYTKTKEATEVFEPLKPKVDPSTKVTRYRAGQVPRFATGYEEERGFVTANSQVRTALTKKPSGGIGSASTVSVEKAPAVRRRFEAQVVANAKSEKAASPKRGSGRHSGLSEDESESSNGEDVANALKDSSSDEDEEEFNRRRRLLRNKMAEKERQQEGSVAVKTERQPVAPQIIKKAGAPAAAAPAAAQKSDTESSAGSSESEWETDTDDSDVGEQLLKPVFVPKKARETLKRQEELETEEERKRQQELERLEQRKLETRKLVAEEIRREKEEGDGDAGMTDVEMPDDTDGVDPDQEYRDWELRELRRIKRDRDRKEQKRQEAEEVLRRRNMTEEERQAEDKYVDVHVLLRDDFKRNVPKEKSKWKFMQKYHHKGVFYVDETSIRDKDDVRNRDIAGATLEDKFNKEMLPKVMQVKNFGRAGQSKYTHLADQDTSRKDSLWARNDS